MEIQQAIIVIMLTAVICIFVAMVSMSMYPDSTEMEQKMPGFNKLARTVLFGFVIIPWIMIVCLTDLYMEQAKLRHDMTENMSCS